MLTTSDVTACLVTRGDQPQMMERIHDTLIFEEELDACPSAFWNPLASPTISISIFLATVTSSSQPQ